VLEFSSEHILPTTLFHFIPLRGKYTTLFSLVKQKIRVFAIFFKKTDQINVVWIGRGNDTRYGGRKEGIQKTEFRRQKKNFYSNFSLTYKIAV
jgi:hypothetical protein